jgi:peptide/nickel transport system permease protein
LFNLLRVVAQRLALGLFTLFIVSLIIASIVELLPGDITQAILGQSATPETVAVFRAELGIDRPVHERYIEWLKGMVTGDMGRSLANRREIAELVGVRLSNTLFLGGFAAAIAVPLSLILGLLAALYRNSIFDR